MPIHRNLAYEPASIHTYMYIHTINVLGYPRLSSCRKETKSITRVLHVSDPVTRGIRFVSISPVNNQNFSNTKDAICANFVKMLSPIIQIQNNNCFGLLYRQLRKLFGD